MKKIKAFLYSFVYAFSGVKILLNERNFRFHCLSFIVVVILGCIFGLSKYEWLIVVLASSFVFALEAINTSIELLCDLVSNEKNNMIKKIKDIAAAAVLIQAIFAIIIALILCFRIAKYFF